MRKNIIETPKINHIYDENSRPEIGLNPIFLGTNKNVQRYDILKYPVFEDISVEMLENFWQPQEMKIKHDYDTYKTLSNAEKRVYDYNIKRQNLLDSLQGRGLLATIGRVLTNSEIEKALTYLQYQEVLHSDSYSYILRNVKDNPSETFDDILEDKVITKHAIYIKQAYEDLYNALAIREANEITPQDTSNEFVKLALDEVEFKKMIVRVLIAWYILEGVRFFVSFACTFSFAEAGKMTGTAQELKLIARDELLHLRLSRNIIKILSKNEDEGFVEIFKDMREEILQSFKDACEDEIEWAHYLFEEGNIRGLNAGVLTSYMKHITNMRTRAIGLGTIFPKEDTMNLPFMDDWLGVNRVEELANELDTSEYKIGKTVLPSKSDWDEIANMTVE
jgi:ribonucleoside-diphosphate reductase beta chain